MVGRSRLDRCLAVRRVQSPMVSQLFARIGKGEYSTTPPNDLLALFSGKDADVMKKVFEFVGVAWLTFA